MAKAIASALRKRHWVWDVVLLLAVFAGVRACRAPDVDASDLPNLSGRALDGAPLALAPAEEPTLVHFWASWCGVCEAEAGHIQALADEGARVITVASRSGSAQRVAAYMQENGWSFQVLNDPNGTLSDRFDVRALPTSFFVSPEGEATSMEVGYTTAWGLRARLWWAGL